MPPRIFARALPGRRPGKVVDQHALIAGRHPPLEAGWTDAPHQILALGDFKLESGECIRDMYLSYVVHGDSAGYEQDRSGRQLKPTVLAFCAIGSTHHRLDFLIGPGRALDPEHLRIVVVDAIGNGLSSSPSNSVLQPGRAFPRFSIADMVHSQHLLLRRLGVRSLHAVVGASMGAMQALAWAVLYPDMAGRIVAMTPMGKAAPWSRLINTMARAQIEAGLARVAAGAPACDAWTDWVPLMQALSMRTPAQFDRELGTDADVGSWLASRLVWWRTQNVDPLDWIAQSHAYDGHDLGKLAGWGGNTEQALAAIRAPVLIAAPALDLYNPLESARLAAERIPRSIWLGLPGESGHVAASAFDVDAACVLNEVMRSFLVP